METTQLGTSDLRVSRIGIGTWAMGGWMWGSADDASSLQALLRAFDLGITLVDTAPIYGDGRAEALVGQAVHSFGRSQIVIATKAGLELLPDGAVRRNARPERLRREVDASLRRLRTDYIDLYQLHWPDPAVPVADSVEAMLRLVEQGKVRALGVSHFPQEQLARWPAELHTVQTPLSLFERGAEEDVLPYCAERGTGTLLCGVLCRGLLTGRMRKDTQFPEGDLRRDDPKFQQPRYDRYLLAVKDLTTLAQRYGKTMTQFAVRWALDRPGASVALWGARTPGQLAEFTGVDGWCISAEDLDLVQEILRRDVTDPVGSEFMVPPIGN